MVKERRGAPIGGEPIHPTSIQVRSPFQGPLTRRSFLGGASGFVGHLPIVKEVSGSGRRHLIRGVSAATTAPTVSTLSPLRQSTPDAGPGNSKPMVGGVLRLVRPAGDGSDFNPASFRQDFQIAVSYLDPLLRVDPETMEPRPWLATGWNLSDDGRSITYMLRPNVFWHDGSPFTAADVEFSLEVYRDDSESGARNLFTAMEQVEITDDLTVRVQLVEPDGTWIFNASTQLMFQRRQYGDYWARNSVGARSLAGFDWQNDLPVGTGPWKVSDWGAEGVTFARNEDYWASPPYFERLVVQWEADADRRFEAFINGDADLLWPVAPEDIELLDPTMSRMYAQRSPTVMFAAFNFFNPERVAPGPLGDFRVRQALSLAVDRERYARQIFEGFISERIAGTIVQPWAHDDTVRAPRRDYERAVTLLIEAGWIAINDDGLRIDSSGVPFQLTLIVRDDEPTSFFSTLRAAKRDLIDVGVELVIEQLPSDRFVERWIMERDYDLIAHSYRVYPGFTDFDLYGSAWDIRLNPRGWNPGGYMNADVDVAIQDALGAYELPDHRDALDRLQQAVNEDLFALWLGVPWDLVAVTDTVRGYEGNLLWPLADTRTLWRVHPVDQGHASP